jgi:tetratricopeptide (TPR) repeat protein
VSIVKRAWNWVLSRFYRRLADAHRHFGNLYGDRQEHEAAVENYTRATVLDPTYAEAYYSRGVLYWREIGNYARAVQDLSRALALEPTRTEAYFNRGLAYLLGNEPDKAMADLERYLVEGTDDFWLESARRQLEELRSGSADVDLGQ